MNKSMNKLTTDNLLVIAEFLPWNERVRFSELNRQLKQEFECKDSLWKTLFEQFFPLQPRTHTPDYKRKFNRYYLKAFKIYRLKPENVSTALKNDKQFVFGCIKRNINPPLLHNDPELFHYTAKKFGFSTLQDATALHDNKAVAYAAVLEDPSTFEHLSARLKLDKDILFAHEHNTMALLSRHKILSAMALIVFVAFLSPMFTTINLDKPLISAPLAIGVSSGVYSAGFLYCILSQYLRKCEFLDQYERLNTLRLAYTVGAGILFAAGVSGFSGLASDATPLNATVSASILFAAGFSGLASNVTPPTTTAAVSILATTGLVVFSGLASDATALRSIVPIPGSTLACIAATAATFKLGRSNFFTSKKPMKEILAAKIAKREAEWAETSMNAP